ncbi:hypothetical protein FACS189476_09410 [Spirochaetia bacterium]|nr:hypothetical protein FACS189476_09410 [Spirochaetia bacterium]
MTCAACAQRIEKAIRKAKALDISKKENVDEDKLRKEREIKILWTKFIVAISLAVPLLYIAMVPMIKWINLPFPQALAPMNFPLLYGLAELILVIPIVAAGNRFYRVGFKALILRGKGGGKVFSLKPGNVFSPPQYRRALLTDRLSSETDCARSVCPSTRNIRIIARAGSSLYLP